MTLIHFRVGIVSLKDLSIIKRVREKHPQTALHYLTSLIHRTCPLNS